MNSTQASFPAGHPGSESPGFFEIRNFSKSFGAVTVVKDMSLSIRRGEFISLLGPSGCGKTTTLRTIAGFTDPDQGQIFLDGQRIDQVSSHKRGAAMVFQNYALFPHMTVAENVAFGLRMQKVPKPDINRRVEEVLELIRLGPLCARYPSELSGGQQQRVALARAIVLKPKLLLLDEPLSNLDAKLRKELRAEFLKIHSLSGATTIFVTHDLEEAFSISDRVALMNQGCVEQFASPVDMFRRPETPFVAEFIGHSNMIGGKVATNSSGRFIPFGSGQVRVTSDLPDGRDIRLAIPAHLIRVGKEPSGSDNSFPVRIRTTSYLGATVRYELDFGFMSLHAEVPAHVDVPIFRPGDHAIACWQASDVIPLPSEAAP